MRTERLPLPVIEMLRSQGARGPWLEVLGELLRLGGSGARFVSHSERPWSSVTFSGARHLVRLAFEGAAVERGEAFVSALPDHEFHLRDRLVADATVTGVEHCLLSGPRMEVEAALLVLDAA